MSKSADEKRVRGDVECETCCAIVRIDRYVAHRQWHDEQRIWRDGWTQHLRQTADESKARITHQDDITEYRFRHLEESVSEILRKQRLSRRRRKPAKRKR